MMQVPFFELKRVYLEQKAEIDRAVARVLESGWYILGKAGEAFEAELSRSLSGNATGAVGCNSGTDALILAMLGADVGPGDEVITPSHTAIPTITAIRSIGAVPVFADIDPRTWVLSAAEAEAAISDRTKAVIAVHLYGNMVDIPALKAAIERKGRGEVTIIEDVAQAQGSRLNGHSAGTMTRFGAFSFYPSKNIGALGDGGAVHAATDTDLSVLRMLRNYGQRDRYNAELGRGLNSRLDEIQAAVLSVRLPRLESWTARKAAMVERYRKELAELPLCFQELTAGCVPAWHLCVVALECRERRDELMRFLKESGVDTLVHYPLPTHKQAAFSAFTKRSLPITEDLAGRIVSLPMNTGLTETEQAHVIARLRAFFS